jgi:biotin carboxyl carrier protein
MLLEKMGMAAAAAGVERELLAPMPGKVLSVAVAPGTAVQEGDAVAVLEAMKMENLIRSPRTGVVAGVAVVPGQAVEKGAVLLTYEDA